MLKGAYWAYYDEQWCDDIYSEHIIVSIHVYIKFSGLTSWLLYGRVSTVEDACVGRRLKI